MTASGLANRLLIGQEIQFIRIDDSDEAIKHMDNETLKEIKNYNMYANDSLLPYLLGNFVVINYIMIPKSITSNPVRLYRLVNIPQFLPNQNKAQQTKNLPETFGLAADGSFYEYGSENERNHNNERNNGNCIRGPITFCREHVLERDMIINKCLAEIINNNHNNFPIQKGKTAGETEQVLLDTPYSRHLYSNLWILSTNKELDCTSSQKTSDTQIPSSGGEDACRVHVTDIAILRTNCFQKSDCNDFTFYSGNYCDDVKKLGVINQQVCFEHRMEIAIPTIDKDQLLDGFRYRRANKSQVTWRCVKNNCSGRVTFDGTQYIKLTDHSHAPNPDEIIAAEFNSKISERAITSHDPPRRIINEALLDVHKDDGTAIPSYTASQHTIERKRKKDDIPLPRPTSFEDISISQQLTVTNGGDRFLLYDNEDSDQTYPFF
ncbi:unnamed protein product [Didymodactylos carnosus]|uniref:FLYWCH-type domain-containing protein n=1 Tax=Didymodactylos carnosus TaxID=1234261 RepID=A0A814GW88_9BILA|nr:unnamed protein product [Didymodactylos carnosus]CAF3773722.1 unnamed protein product [Didymodactylos carnosus]